MNSHNKQAGKKSSTSINSVEEKKPSWIDKVKGKLADSEARNPHRITPRPDLRVVRRPVMVDVEQIPSPTSTLDLFDTLPTLTLAKRAALERMKMNKIMSMEEEYYFNQESQEFDQEVQRDMNEAFGGQEMAERQAEAQSLASQLPDIDPLGDADVMQSRPPQRRRGLDELERNLI